MSQIHKANQEFVGTAYDTTFRKQAAASGNRRWSAVNACLYSLCFTGKATPGKYCDLCFSTAHVVREWAIPLNNCTPLLMTKNVVQRGSNGNVLGGCSTAVRCVQRGSNGNVLEGCPTSGCVLRGCPTS